MIAMPTVVCNLWSGENGTSCTAKTSEGKVVPDSCTETNATCLANRTVLFTGRRSQKACFSRLDCSPSRTSRDVWNTYETIEQQSEAWQYVTDDEAPLASQTIRNLNLSWQPLSQLIRNWTACKSDTPASLLNLFSLCPLTATLLTCVLDPFADCG